jgi:ABC-type lipoprotein release transport system permease subunit
MYLKLIFKLDLTIMKKIWNFLDPTTIMGTLSANELLLGLFLDAVFDLKQFIDYSMITFLFVIVILVSIIAAALPVYRVMKLDVIEAIRAV